MSQMLIRYLKDDIVIKAKEKKLKSHIENIDKLNYPFTLIKSDLNNHFMLCNSNSCFAEVENFEEVEKQLLS
jgi:hypothetical protein